MKSGAHYFTHRLCEYLGTPPNFSDITNSSMTNLPMAFYNIISGYNVPALKDCGNGLYASISTSANVGATITLKKLEQAASGSYGVLYYCNVDKKYYYLKTSKEASASLKNEAFLQLGAHIMLSYYNMPWAVPAVRHIVNLPGHDVCFTMDIVTDMKIFGKYMMDNMLWGIKTVRNDVLVMELLCQMALYIMILEKELGMNHRDLKLNNVLMVKEQALANHTIEIDGVSYILNSGARAVLIDFGFACIGDVEKRASLLSASEYGMMVDMCPKAGRDIFLILANMWNVPAVRGALTGVATGLFKKWLVDNTGKNWSTWLVENRDPELKNVYNAMNNAEFVGVNSMPTKILDDIAAAYPGVLRIGV